MFMLTLRGPDRVYMGDQLPFPLPEKVVLDPIPLHGAMALVPDHQNP